MFVAHSKILKKTGRKKDRLDDIFRSLLDHFWSFGDKLDFGGGILETQNPENPGGGRGGIGLGPPMVL